jgi:hypothetical protein
MPRKSDDLLEVKCLGSRISTYWAGQVCKRRASVEEKVQIVGKLSMGCRKGKERSGMGTEQNPVDFRLRFQDPFSRRKVRAAQLFRHPSIKYMMVNVRE